MTFEKRLLTFLARQTLQPIIQDMDSPLCAVVPRQTYDFGTGLKKQVKRCERERGPRIERGFAVNEWPWWDDVFIQA